MRIREAALLVIDLYVVLKSQVDSQVESQVWTDIGIPSACRNAVQPAMDSSPQLNIGYI